MRGNKKGNSSEKIPKLPKGVSQEFLDEINPMKIEELKAKIVTLQVQVEENEAFKESAEYIAADEEFKVAKERHLQVVGPVKEVSVSLKNRTKEVVKRLQEKGGA